MLVALLLFGGVSWTIGGLACDDLRLAKMLI